MKNMLLHLVHNKLCTKFKQLWYNKNRLKVCLKITPINMVFKSTSHWKCDILWL